MSKKCAVLGLPDLARLLQSEGVPVLSESTAIDTARAARDELTNSPAGIDAAIVVDSAEDFLQKWARAATPRLEHIVVLHGASRSLVAEGARHLDLPIDANQVLEAAGINAPAAASAWFIEADGSVTITEQGTDDSVLPSEDDWGIPETTDRPPAATANDPMSSSENQDQSDHEPLAEEPSTEPAPATADDDSNPWTQAQAPTQRAPEDQPLKTSPAVAPIEASAPATDPLGPLASRRLARQESAPKAEPEPEFAEEDILVDDIFEISANDVAYRPRSGARPVIFIKGMKGGVGKTSSALGLAERATARGLKVTLIDMNRGQADIATILRLTRAGKPVVPTIYEATTGGPAAAIIEPEQINAARPKGLPPIGFKVVLGPPKELADPAVVTEALYRSVIEAARKESDLVIVDTQILEASDTSNLFDRVVFPYVASGQWSLVVTGLSSTALSNTKPGVLRMIEHGASTSHILSFLNEAPTKGEGQTAELARMPAFFGQFSTYLGAVDRDPTLPANMNAGVVNKFPAQMDAIFDDCLFRVLGLEPEIRLEDVTKKRSRGIIGKLIGSLR